MFVVILVAFGFQARKREASRSEERSSWELSRLDAAAAEPAGAPTAGCGRPGWLGLADGDGRRAPSCRSGWTTLDTFAHAASSRWPMLAVSVSLLTGTSGQISMGQVAFLGLGAAIAYQATKEHSLLFLRAVLLAGVVGALAAVAIGLPALRQRRPVPRGDHARASRFVTQNWLLGP